MVEERQREWRAGRSCSAASPSCLEGWRCGRVEGSVAAAAGAEGSVVVASAGWPGTARWGAVEQLEWAPTSAPGSWRSSAPLLGF